MNTPTATPSPPKHLVTTARRDGLFSACDALAARSGKLIWKTRQPSASDAVFFDLASLTKPLCTALLFWIAVDEALVSLEDSVAKFLPSENLARTSIRELLNHTSTLKDWHDFAREMSNPKDFSRNQNLILERLLNDPTLVRTSKGVLYSDLGYMVLGTILETLFNASLDKVFTEKIAKPLGIADDIFFVPLTKRRRKAIKRFVVSEPCPWRGRELRGEVMDENAWVCGGVSGHAGLFGTAAAVHRILRELRLAQSGKSKILSREGCVRHLAVDTKRDAARRFFTPGFDTPTQPHSQSGRCFSANTVGHLGYSGTSFWWDRTRDAWIVLLANRCWRGRENPAFAAWRPRFHNAVWRDAHLSKRRPVK